MGGSPESRKFLQSHTSSIYTTTSHYHNQKDKRRPWRILAFAFFFVATTMRRLHITTSSYETYFTSLLDVSGSSQSSLSNTRYQSDRDADLIIFYNLYIPQDEEGIVNAINVIKDQIGQIAKVLKRMENEASHSSSKKKQQSMVK